MKKVLVILICLFLAGVLYAEDSATVKSAASFFQSSNDSKLKEYQDFIGQYDFDWIANKATLDRYKDVISTLTGKLYVLRSSITNEGAQKVPNVARVRTLQTQYNSILKDYEAVSAEFNQFVSGLK